MMQFSVALSLLSALASAYAAETVLGAYIFHRHGDRTPKSLAPTNLTALGYEQVYTSGQYYRSRYLTGPSKIRGISEDIVKLTQLSVTAPVDNVLQNSATGFLQGLYPPVPTIQTLANGNTVQAPMDGYQLIPVNTIQTNAGSEDASWLQDASTCANAKISSNAYFASKEYTHLLNTTTSFYNSLVPVVNSTLDAQDITYKNAYIIYDLINVAEIHNSSIRNSSPILTNATLLHLRTLADAHEWGLAYNASDNMRAIAGMQLAGDILKYMTSTIASGRKSPPADSNKLAIQFGAYATFLSFFGLAGLGLDKADTDFKGLPDYASSLAFELFTTEDVEGGRWPADRDLKVRFLFHNGTASDSSGLAVFPLFGASGNAVSWPVFSAEMGRFAVGTSAQWCSKCGNEMGACARFNGAAGTGSRGGQGSGCGGEAGVSPAVGGVIGAFVTLAVVVGGLAAAVLLGGVTVVRKRGVVSRGEGEGAVKA
ncbi:phosphoglycerate mutase-like protein [Byssothecium circinans]|uniref:Phosphoglycerate mutase-like protein n=1 Tax=Byssothecium circinans TaxID=147558 RepID=A0A6A5TLX4_9PLEO|nr:phosphoglycerate mutase-like protein [Byssothecium circinans]